MAGNHRGIGPKISAGKQTVRAGAGRKRRQPQPIRRNRWFAMLYAAAADDVAERGSPPDLSQDQVFAWADAYHARTGDWPNWNAGAIPESARERWMVVEAALVFGLRGFAGGSTLLQLLAEHWRRPGHPQLDFTIEQILAWADAWYERTGRRPITTSGSIPGTQGITWKMVNSALLEGRTDRPAGLWLSRLLHVMRGVHRFRDQPLLTEVQILAWADAHFQRTGTWPTRDAGWIVEAPGEAWNRIDEALERGLRGLPGDSSLPRLLASRRGVRNKSDLPPMSVEQILAWADTFHARQGEWPDCRSGPIAHAPGETWQAVQSALTTGIRGLPGGSSLTQLLTERRGARNPTHPPPLSIPQILAWADAFHAQAGQWPTSSAGAITEGPGETWNAVHIALYQGLRGLPGGSSLPRLLAQERGVRNIQDLPPFTVPEILRWADVYRDRHGTWPTCNSGPISEASGETWRYVHDALYIGQRDLPGGSSLARLLAEQRGVRNIQSLPPLSEAQVLAWADAHHARTGGWPKHLSGPIVEAPGEKWLGVENALRLGLRGLPGGSSLHRLLVQERGVRRAASPRNGNR